MYPTDPIYTIGQSDFRKDWFFMHVPRFDEQLSAQAAANAPPRGGGRGPATGPAVARGPATAPAARGGRGALGFGDLFGPAAIGKPTTYTIAFNLPAAPTGKATLRLAFCGNGTRTLGVAVNNKDAGQLDRLITDGVISSHGQHGIWNEREFTFDAKMLNSGLNAISLTVPQGNVNNGIIYDYLRLELDENAAPTASAALP
jgi:rhamnogalacturonan endolyase